MLTIVFEDKKNAVIYLVDKDWQMYDDHYGDGNGPVKMEMTLQEWLKEVLEF